MYVKRLLRLDYHINTTVLLAALPKKDMTESVHDKRNIRLQLRPEWGR